MTSGTEMTLVTPSSSATMLRVSGERSSRTEQAPDFASRTSRRGLFTRFRICRNFPALSQIPVLFCNFPESLALGVVLTECSFGGVRSAAIRLLSFSIAFSFASLRADVVLTKLGLGSALSSGGIG